MLPRIEYASALPGATWFLARPCSPVDEILSKQFLVDLKEMKARATVNEPLLRRHLRELCAEAIRCGIRSEQVLIALKDMWAMLPASPMRGNPALDADVRRALVAGVLDAYYGATAADR